MKKTLRGLLALVATGALTLGACSGTASDKKGDTKDKSTTSAPAEYKAPVKISFKDPKGNPAEITLEKMPKKVVLLDNRSVATLENWGIKPVAVPKPVLSKNAKFKNDDSIKDVGSHTETNFEIIAAAKPDLIIVGQRFGQHYDKIKDVAKDAPVLYNDIKLPKEVKDTKASEAGKILADSLKKNTTDLGKIFGKEKEAEKINADFDKSIEAAKKAIPAGDKVLAVNTNGGKLGYLAPHVGRTLGPLYDILGWTPAIAVKEGTNNHKGDEVSVETLAQSNPQWIFVMDRDAAVGSKNNAAHGVDLVKSSPAMANVDAVKKNHIIAMPDDTYVNESIQLFTKFFNDLAKQAK
ncbi:siderophore ABC transporter substrate-binding protein [Actinotignum urinale]|uniref:ABC transporter substrate-binding protein n=1 Tax=Actinotignum urinale TaxID=190146 RepID=A0AAW9HXH3_9ACTO|nr:ABC transporter substrate-binding protein [Actinotignum urinale]MDY5132654.1 ABC transporter substrate-binding protein [Actinotignum urinale]MDY5155125.1 ABC transporter substrate-binding protein [Actinotignum urinale]MDY5160600.1 ABC transporter substrate-binding protein [Actinotignum urinale]